MGYSSLEYERLCKLVKSLVEELYQDNYAYKVRLDLEQQPELEQGEVGKEGEVRKEGLEEVEKVSEEWEGEDKEKRREEEVLRKRQEP